LSFRTTITLAVLGLITALALCLIAIQLAVFHAAVKTSASANMDAASAKSLTPAGSGGLGTRYRHSHPSDKPIPCR
jgi:hypothetical protein